MFVRINLKGILVSTIGQNMHRNLLIFRWVIVSFFGYLFELFMDFFGYPFELVMDFWVYILGFQGIYIFCFLTDRVSADLKKKLIHFHILRRCFLNVLAIIHLLISFRVHLIF